MVFANATAGFVLFALMSAVALCIGGNDPLNGEPQRALWYTWLSAGFGFGALATLVAMLAAQKPLRLSFSTIFIFALVLRLIAAWAWPLLEDDYFRYLWDGRQTVLTLSPWAHPPEYFFATDGLFDWLPPDRVQQWHWVLNNINYPELPSVYGPVLQYLFGLAYFIAPAQLGAIQGLLLLVDMGILVSLYRMGVGKTWLAAYAVHPLILKEAIASAHPDIVVGLALLWVVYGWKQHKPILVGIALGCALATKISALMALPFILIGPSWILRNRVDLIWPVTVLISCVITLLVLYVPLLQASGSEWYSLQTFAQQWRFNPLLFRVIESVFVMGGFSGNSARFFAIVCIGLGVIALLLFWLKPRTNKKSKRINEGLNLPPVDLALLVLLLFSPVVNSWYWLWLLPLTVLLNRPWLFVYCCFCVLSYGHSGVLTVLNADSLFYVPWWNTVLQLGVLALCFGIAHQGQKNLNLTLLGVTKSA